MKFLKKIFRGINKIIVSRKNKKRAFSCAKRFLEKGSYYVPHGTNQFRKAEKCSFFKRLYSNKEQDSLQNLTNQPDLAVDHIAFGVGNGKIVLMSESNAYGFYNTKKSYLNAKQSYEKFHALFNYPCVEYHAFHDDWNCIEMQNVSGTSFSDLGHDKIVVRKMLEAAGCSSAIITSWGATWLLQHGDATSANVLWDGDVLTFIDLDNLGYYVPLLDVFHYLCNYKFSEILKLLQENDDLIRKICERCGINTEGNYLDDLIRGYARHYTKLGFCLEDIRFLSLSNTVEFPKTHELLKAFKTKKR